MTSLNETVGTEVETWQENTCQAGSPEAPPLALLGFILAPKK